jgi:hypothetical protein
MDLCVLPVRYARLKSVLISHKTHNNKNDRQQAQKAHAFFLRLS